MFKLIVPVCLSLAILSPSISNGQDCGCDNCEIGSGDYEAGSGDYGADCVKTRKKLALVESCIEIKRLRRVCETDECGCSRSRLALVSEPFSFKRLGLVDVPVDPCRPNLLERMRERMASLGGNRGGCDSGCDSGCDTCEDGVYDQGSFDGEIIGADCGSDGGPITYGNAMPAESNAYSAPMENNVIETSPRFTTPRATDVMPRNVQPRNIVPRGTTPRTNSNINDNPIEVEGHSG